MARYLICGWYGEGNLGDEAILKSIVKRIENIDDKSEIMALSTNPEYTQQFLSIKSFKHFPLSFKETIKNIFNLNNYKQLYNAVKWCDIFILGGGGFLSDWNLFNPFSWLKYIIVAKLLRKKCIVYSIGAGPFFTSIGKLFIKSVFNNCFEFIIVRDDESKKLLNEIGVIKEIFVTVDPVVDLFPLTNFKSRVDDGYKVGFVINPYLKGRNDEKYESLKKSIISIIENLSVDNEIFLIPFEPKNDLSFCLEIKDNLNGVGIKNIDILSSPCLFENEIENIKKMDLLITLRLHGSIIATALSIPFIAINYHHKGHEFIRKLNWDFGVDFGEGKNWVDTDIDEELVVSMFDKIKNNHNFYVNDLINKRGEYKKSLVINDRLLAELIE